MKTTIRPWLNVVVLASAGAIGLWYSAQSMPNVMPPSLLVDKHYRWSRASRWFSSDHTGQKVHASVIARRRHKKML